MTKHFYLKLWTATQITADLDEVHGGSATALRSLFLAKSIRSYSKDEAHSERSVDVVTQDTIETILEANALLRFVRYLRL